MGQIIALIVALPQIYGLVMKIIAQLTKLFGKDWPSKLIEGDKVFDELAQATTPEQRANASKKLADLFNNV